MAAKTALHRLARAVGRLAGVKPETVEKALRDLRKKGYLKLVGKTSKGYGSNINSFTIPKKEENEAGVTPDTPHEDAGIPARGDGDTPHKNADNSLTDPLNDPLKFPLARQFDDFAVNGDLADFLADEPGRRDEYINYLLTLDPPYSYSHIFAIFKETMAGATRSDWVAVFKTFIAKLSDADDWNECVDDVLGYGVERVEGTRLKHAEGFSHEDFAAVWQGHRDNVDSPEYRRAWEHALLFHPGTRILAVASSSHATAKYPREFADVLKGLSPAQLSQLTTTYRTPNP